MTHLHHILLNSDWSMYMPDYSLIYFVSYDFILDWKLGFWMFFCAFLCSAWSAFWNLIIWLRSMSCCSIFFIVWVLLEVISKIICIFHACNLRHKPCHSIWLKCFNHIDHCGSQLNHNHLRMCKNPICGQIVVSWMSWWIQAGCKKIESNLFATCIFGMWPIISLDITELWYSTMFIIIYMVLGENFAWNVIKGYYSSWVEINWVSLLFHLQSIK